MTQRRKFLRLYSALWVGKWCHFCGGQLVTKISNVDRQAGRANKKSIYLDVNDACTEQNALPTKE